MTKVSANIFHSPEVPAAARSGMGNKLSDPISDASSITKVNNLKTCAAAGNDADALKRLAVFEGSPCRELATIHLGILTV